MAWALVSCNWVQAQRYMLRERTYLARTRVLPKSGFSELTQSQHFRLTSGVVVLKLWTSCFDPVRFFFITCNVETSDFLSKSHTKVHPGHTVESLKPIVHSQSLSPAWLLLLPAPGSKVVWVTLLAFSIREPSIGAANGRAPPSWSPFFPSL